ncbi:putative GTP-binding protein [Neospora caninum Liverpool]|uniref:GTP-binding protein, putative n=1 Tax=Neospora caninum (strain Liverpool) TaxID=572307 RepID=F0V7S5_NEOCL|nr:putative GTP-binding protein [Neospora caninum Liverpool]CBZ49766.1 putative GTP-binding protein [Neospora caninum Liverpool]CEL64353.1 TPA: GTP-binding protein, putative [Neospora caninum Liverpool]|eukprot:XP_003879801.1 putative GTP-binding protein [Neospora caninum Liverpool]
MGCTTSSSAASAGESQLRMANAGSLDDGFSERLNLEAKIVLLGDSGVGKSSLALRFCRGRFPQYHEVTIGAAFLQQTVKVANDGSQLKLYIWDTGGQERFRAMAPLYYRDAAGAVVVYDVTNLSSMDAVRFWVEELKQRGPQNCRIAVAANKSDSIEPQTDSELATPPEGETKAVDAEAERRAEMKKYCAAEGMLFVECSAKTGYNVGLLFEQLAKEVFEQLKQSMMDL